MYIPNYQSYVEAANNALGNGVTRGADSAFEVLNLAVNKIRQAGDLNAGLIIKTSGNRSRDRSVDLIGFKGSDGRVYLVDAIAAAGDPPNPETGDPGGRPTWNQLRDEDALPLERWVEPYPVDVQPPVEDQPAEEPGDTDTGATIELGLLFKILGDKLDRIIANQDEQTLAVRAAAQQLHDAIKAGVKTTTRLELPLSIRR